MATITTSIGTRAAENIDITNVTGGGPYTVTLSGATSTTNNGDTLTDEAASPNSYLITGGAGTATLTVTDSFGAGTAPDYSATTQATTTRTYATITAWEAALDDTNLYAATNDAVGEVYNDSAFDETVTINGGGTVGLNSITLTVPVGERHDGTAGTGARMVMTASNQGIIINETITNTIEWLEIDENGQSINRVVHKSDASSSDTTFRNLIIHDQVHTGSSSGYGSSIYIDNRRANVLNNIIYDVETNATTTGDFYGIFGNAGTDVNFLNILNNTVYNYRNNNGTGGAYGIILKDLSTRAVRNNIAMDPGGTTSGTKADFSPSTFSNATTSNNLSSDATASGTGSLTNKSSANQFVSITGGSEDLHLKAGADAIDAGTDLGTTPTGVNFDIDNRDRDAQGDTWDIGADEFVSTGIDVDLSEGTLSGDTISTLLTAFPTILESILNSDIFNSQIQYLLSLSEIQLSGDEFSAFSTKLTSISEGIKQGESFSSIVSQLSSLSDSIKASDIFSIISTLQTSQSDQTKIGDLFSILTQINTLISDGNIVSDEWSTNLSSLLSHLQGSILSDSFSAEVIGGLEGILSEGISLSDSISVQSLLYTLLSEGVKAGSSIVVQAILQTLLTEGILLGESWSVGLLSSLSAKEESFILSDEFIASVVSSLSGALSSGSILGEQFIGVLAYYASLTHGFKASDTFSTALSALASQEVETIKLGNTFAVSSSFLTTITETIILSDMFSYVQITKTPVPFTLYITQLKQYELFITQLMNNTLYITPIKSWDIEI